MATVQYAGTGCDGDLLAVYEELAPNGNVTFRCAGDGKVWLVLPKRVVPNTNPDPRPGGGYGKFTKQQVLTAGTDLLGNELLNRSAGFTYRDVIAVVPPLRLFQNTACWVGSRGAAVDATFDCGTAMAHTCSDVIGTGAPSLDLLLDPATRSRFAKTFELEGLVGGWLPVAVMGFPAVTAPSARQQPGNLTAATSTAEAGQYWEMTIVPVPEGTGNEQPVMLRFLCPRCGPGGSPAVHYFDTFAYTGISCNGTALDDCGYAGEFFTTLLDVHFFWQRTWADEGAMTLALPGADGAVLLDQARHALVLDMITRNNVW